MKLNNKGVSLMELLVSIILIGIVLVFLFQLLVDLKDETSNNEFAFDNQVNRAEIIKTIQNDLDKILLKDIKIYDSGRDISLLYYYNGAPSVTSLDVSSSFSSLTYRDVDGNKNVWTLKNASFGSCVDFYAYKLNNKMFYKINIKVYTGNENNSVEKNNPIDDIEISGIISNNGSYGWTDGLLKNLNEDEVVKRQIGQCS